MWAPGQSTLYDTAPDDDRRTLTRLGVCADVSGVFLAANGEPVQTDLTQRMIGINAEQMRAIPDVTTIAYGTAQVPAAHAALRSGLITGLVTHKTFAQALLDAA